MYDTYGVFLGNVYENLVWLNGSTTSQILPWLAQNYTVSSDRSTYSMSLRSGISFQDGEPLNSSAVYFSLNRVLVLDGSTPTSHGTQFAPDFQQMLNFSLSTALCGCRQVYNAQYVDAILSQNFVQVAGPQSFSIHLEHPNSFLLYALAGYNYGWILAPEFVMQHDLALWNKSSNGYSLPYSTLTGNLSSQIHQYFLDLVATCDSGATPSGCGTTYLDGSYQGSTAGTGPYSLQSFDATTNDLTFQSNPSYWGGGYQYAGGHKLVPFFQTVKMVYAPDLTTRELDVRNAGNSGQAMIIDLPNSNLYDVADRQAWTTNHQLKSTLSGVTITGPWSNIGGSFIGFNTNVTNPVTKEMYSFQPFADQRIRLALADSVNLSEIGVTVNNNLGQVMQNIIPPTTPPQGSYNSSISPAYSYNPVMVQNLLLDAMKNPITSFTFTNGTTAPSGLFNNTFGCPVLGANNQCSSPVAHSIVLNFASGDAVNQAIEEQIATVVNNVSSTYNMGLTIDIAPVPLGFMFTNIANEYAFNFNNWAVDYPWVLSVTGLFAPSHFIAALVNYNSAAYTKLYNESISADAAGNISGVIAISQQIASLVNQQVPYLNTFAAGNVAVFTSNIQGLLILEQTGGVYYWSGESG